jgi:putative pyruvate formate lyase activating enzyme
MWKITNPDAEAVLHDELAQKSLARYFAVTQNKKTAKFLIAKRLPARFDPNDTLETLWKEHEKSTEDFHKIEQELDTGKEPNELPKTGKSYFDLKIEIANRIIRQCHFCSRTCGVNRLTGELGYCKCGDSLTVSNIFAHVGEEPELVPSGTIFTLGCTIRCRHCQNWAISQWMEPGTECKPKDMAREVERLRFSGCRNVNLVGGEPTPWLLQWLETFKHVTVNVPVVWNSNSYYSPETARLLAGFADVYLLDFKYGPADCA